MTSPHTEQGSDLSRPDLPPGLITLKTFIFLYTTHIYLSNELKLLFFFCLRQFHHAFITMSPLFRTVGNGGGRWDKEEPP